MDCYGNVIAHSPSIVAVTLTVAKSAFGLASSDLNAADAAVAFLSLSLVPTLQRLGCCSCLVHCWMRLAIDTSTRRRSHQSLRQFTFNASWVCTRHCNNGIETTINGAAIALVRMAPSHWQLVCCSCFEHCWVGLVLDSSTMRRYQLSMHRVSAEMHYDNRIDKTINRVASILVHTVLCIP